MSGTTERKRLRKAVRERDGDLCHWCGKPMRFGKREAIGIREPDDWATLEHILPISQGGTDDLGNLALAHKLCNSSRKVAA